MKCYSLLTLACFLAFQATAQKVYTDTRAFQYFDKDWHEIPSKGNAAYLRIYNDINADKKIYEIRDFTIDGQLLCVSQSSSKEALFREGLTSWYNAAGTPIKAGYYENNKPAGRWMRFYDNGRKKVAYTYPDNVKELQRTVPYEINNSWDSTGKAEVVDDNGIFIERDDSTNMLIAKGPIKDGLHDGHWEGYRPDGQKTYEEDYKTGVLVKGTRYEANGQANYTELNVLPTFPGGEEGLAKFLSRNIHYPKEAQAQNISGTVFVQFIVQPNGAITDIGVNNGAARSLNQEAVRVVGLMPKWNPGSERGKKIASPFTLPIRFSR